MSHAFGEDIERKRQEHHDELEKKKQDQAEKRAADLDRYLSLKEQKE